jgi:hypothetical protein
LSDPLRKFKIVYRNINADWKLAKNALAPGCNLRWLDHGIFFVRIDYSGSSRFNDRRAFSAAK